MNPIELLDTGLKGAKAYATNLVNASGQLHKAVNNRRGDFGKIRDNFVAGKINTDEICKNLQDLSYFVARIHDILDTIEISQDGFRRSTKKIDMTHGFVMPFMDEVFEDYAKILELIDVDVADMIKKTKKDFDEIDKMMKDLNEGCWQGDIKSRVAHKFEKWDWHVEKCF